MVMSRPQKFEFARSRGIVWVCDVAGSSSRLNSDHGVEDTEAFLPRLYWIAVLVVESAGGKFIKWTGDGFLAWFETPLHRDLHRTAIRCLEAVWHLTVIVNVTQLGLTPKRRFKIRHGLTYEQDAFLTKIIHHRGFETLDLIGRSVVLAFRLSGITADFPCIATHRDIVEAVGNNNGPKFRRWVPSAEESLKHFKGEKWGTRSLYVSVEKMSHASHRKAIAKQARAAIREAEGQVSTDDARLAFSKLLYEALMAGPEWSRNVAEDYTDFIRDGLLKNLKAALFVLDRTPVEG